MAEDPGDTEQHPSQCQCGKCGFDLSGFSILNFCPKCGAKQNTEEEISSSTKQVSRATHQQSPVAELSPKPGHPPHESKNETQSPFLSQPANGNNISILHVPESPTRVPQAPHPSGSDQHMAQENSGQPPGWRQLSVEKGSRKTNAKSTSGPDGSYTQKQKQPISHTSPVKVSWIIITHTHTHTQKNTHTKKQSQKHKST